MPQFFRVQSERRMAIVLLKKLDEKLAITITVCYFLSLSRSRSKTPITYWVIEGEIG